MLQHARLDVSSSRPCPKYTMNVKPRVPNKKVKMMQAVWGERWWGRKKRKLQDNLEEKRRNEEIDRLADSNRLENMRQRRIKRKMGACKYYCWPCGRAEYEKMFPRANIVVADPEAEEAERQRKVFPCLQKPFKLKRVTHTQHAGSESWGNPFSATPTKRKT